MIPDLTADNAALRAALLALVQALDAAPLHPWTREESIAAQDAKALLYAPAVPTEPPVAEATLFPDEE